MQEDGTAGLRKGVSAVITTAGRPQFLDDALSSVSAQDSPPDEVLVVYDDDRTPELPPSLRGMRAKALATPGRAGASVARNLGARASTSEWLAFLDDDDWWLPEYLKTARRLGESLDADVVCTSFLVAHGMLLEPEKSAPIDLQSADFFSHNPGLRASNLMIRRSLLLELGGFAEDLPALNDLDLGLRLAAVPGLRYGRVPDRLVVFRNHNGPRLASRRSPALQAALPVFLARHSTRMTLAQQAAFLGKMKRLWEIEIV